MRWLTDVRHEDGIEWVMRYYDVRILPHWLKVLTQEQRQTALAPIDQWAYLNPQFEWEVVKGPNQMDASHSDEPMRQTERQASSLLGLCMPHMLLIQLQEDFANLLDKIDAKKQYDWMSEQLELASQYRIEGMNDLKSFALLSLQYGPNAHQYPAIQKLLSEKPAEGEFTRAIAALSHEDLR